MLFAVGTVIEHSQKKEPHTEHAASPATAAVRANESPAEAKATNPGTGGATEPASTRSSEHSSHQNEKRAEGSSPASSTEKSAGTEKSGEASSEHAGETTAESASTSTDAGASASTRTKQATHRAAAQPARSSTTKPAETTSTPENSREHARESTNKTGTGERAGETNSEKIAGVNPESWPLVGLAIAVSLLIAAGVYVRRGRWFAAAVAFGILFAAGDVREVTHQIQESRTTMATIAGVLIALHLLVVAAAAWALWLHSARTRSVPEGT